MKYIGQPIPVYDAVAKVSGEALYTDDMVFSNPLYGAILTSPHAHARIVHIDASQALALPGVEAVITHEDAPETLYCRNMRRIHDDGPALERVFNTTVRYVGDKVAAVAAQTEELARKALQLIQVEYEVLPAVFDQQEALAADAYPLYEGGNLAKNMPVLQHGNVEAALAAAAHVVEQRAETAMLHHGAIEPHLCVAYWSREDELSLWEPQRAPFRAQIMLGKIFGIPHSKIHIHGQTIGGTFGSKESMILQPVALLLSKKTGRTVKIRYSRKECIASTFTRHAVKMRTKVGVNEDGIITAIYMEAWQRVGAYAGDSLSILASMAGKYFKLYTAENIRFHGFPAYTNTPLGGSMRGYGSPALFMGLETAIDSAARAAGIDPVDFHLRNLVDPFATDPHSGLSLGNARVKDCLQRGAKAFRWAQRRKDCETMADKRYAYGCGMATAMHGNGVAPFASDITVASIELHEDGTVLLRTGVSDHGAGTYTLYKQLVAEILDMPLAHVEIVFCDTHAGHYDKGAGASRNTWVGGRAVQDVCKTLLADMLETAAELMELPVEEVILHEQNFQSKNGDCVRSKLDVAEYACETQKRRLVKILSYNSPKNAGSYGAHFAHVRVDRKTGEVQVLNFLAACDVGRVLNPLLLSGQIEGAIMMGLGMALFEEIVLDEKGAVKNGNFKRYRMAKMKDLPNIQIEFVEAGEEGGPFDAKSIGEASTVPVAPAIVNAINHALGTSLASLPITPEKILKALA